jgi:hypothetical protein
MIPVCQTARRHMPEDVTTSRTQYIYSHVVGDEMAASGVNAVMQLIKCTELFRL